MAAGRWRHLCVCVCLTPGGPPASVCASNNVAIWSAGSRLSRPVGCGAMVGSVRAVEGCEVTFDVMLLCLQLFRNPKRYELANLV
jgi:hypothetical protein